MVSEAADFRITQMACDTDSRRILLFIKSTSRSIKEISESCNIPLAKCYRKVKEMEDRGMLRRLEINESKASTYRSNLKCLQVSIEGDHLSLNIQFKDGTKRIYEFDAGAATENSMLA